VAVGIADLAYLKTRSVDLIMDGHGAAVDDIVDLLGGAETIQYTALVAAREGNEMVGFTAEEKKQKCCK
jgi:hypothetical protein